MFPGGAEMYALELFETLCGSDEIEPVLVARADLAGGARRHGLYTGATFKTVEGDPQQYFMFTEFEDFDPVLGTSEDQVALHKRTSRTSCVRTSRTSCTSSTRTSSATTS